MFWKRCLFKITWKRAWTGVLLNWITTPDSVEYFWGLMISVPAFFSVNVSLLFNIFHVLHLFCCSFFTVNQCSKCRKKIGGKIGQRLNVKNPLVIKPGPQAYAENLYRIIMTTLQNYYGVGRSVPYFVSQ